MPNASAPRAAGWYRSTRAQVATWMPRCWPRGCADSTRRPAPSSWWKTSATSCALGEHARAVVASVTEGADKPLKYPHMFRGADVLVLNKIDLLPYVDFDVDHFEACARAVNPGVRILRTCATRGEGLDLWTAWLREQISQAPIG
jgi:CobW/HypB/UreG family nucleotide-binding protein